jgi:hypothetical protein
MAVWHHGQPKFNPILYKPRAVEIADKIETLGVENGFDYNLIEKKDERGTPRPRADCGESEGPGRELAQGSRAAGVWGRVTCCRAEPTGPRVPPPRSPCPLGLASLPGFPRRRKWWAAEAENGTARSATPMAHMAMAMA